jgi:hypothetical protein
VADAADPARPASIGADDLWLATHWTTAEALRPVLPRMRRPDFLYLVQDFEPGFYPWSSNYALATATYAMPHRAIFNEQFLADYVRAMRPGLYADSGFLAARCKVFEPAVDRRVFYPPASRRDGKRRLLFYARPTNPRNLFGIGVAALRAAIAAGIFDAAWEFVGIGGRGSVPPIALGGGHVLRPEPWDSYDAYAETLRRGDVLLCPMLSPHTSYPVLEMAACGGKVVTNVFGPKTEAELAALSPDILGVDPSPQGFAEGLRLALARLDEARTDRLCLSSDWQYALGETVDWTVAALAAAEGKA